MLLLLQLRALKITNLPVHVPAPRIRHAQDEALINLRLYHAPDAPKRRGGLLRARQQKFHLLRSGRAPLHLRVEIKWHPPLRVNLSRRLARLRVALLRLRHRMLLPTHLDKRLC